MKTARLLLAFPLAVAFAATLRAVVPSTVDFIVVNKSQNFTQSGSGTVADASEPFTFSLDVSGQNLNGTFPTPPNSFTAPAGSTTTGSVTLSAPNMFQSEWRHEQTFSSQLAMDTAYANGTYTLSIGGQSFGLNLLGNLYPNTPTLTPTANGDVTWLPDGTLLYYAGNNNPLTLTTNLFTSTASFVHIGLFIDPTQGQNTNFPDFESEYFGPGTGSLTLSQTFLTPSEFVSGTVYTVNVEFNVVSDGPNSLSAIYSGNPAYASAQAVAIYTARTSFNLLVIPEPSSYAALAGAGALALAVWRRRRAA